MSNIRTATLAAVLLVSVLLSSMLAGGCGASELTLRNGATLDTVHLADMDDLAPGFTALIRAGDSTFVFAGAVDDSIRMVCYSRSLRKVWGHNTYIEAAGAPVGMAEIEGRSHVLWRIGSTISSIVFGEYNGDTAVALARQYDAATGRELGVKSLSRVHLDRRVDNRDYHQAISRDSLYVALAIYVEQPGTDSIAMLVSLFDKDLRKVADDRLVISSVHNEPLQNSLAVDNNGTVYSIRYDDDDTIRCTQFDLLRSKRRQSLKVHVSDTAHPYNTRFGYGAVQFPNDSQMIVISGRYGGKEMVGVGIMRFNTRSFRTEYSVLIPSEASWFHPSALVENAANLVVAGNHPSARFIRVHEQAWNARGDHADHLRAFAFDVLGNATWQHHLEKSYATPVDGFEAILSNVSVTTRNTLRVLFRESDAFVVTELSLADGRELEDKRKIIASVGRAVNYDVSTFKWIDDGEAFFILSQSRGTPDWVLCRLKLPR